MSSETTNRTIHAARPGGRPFGITDAMILTAGAALALSASTHLIVLMVETFGRFWREASVFRGELPGRFPAFWVATHDLLRNTLWYGLQVAFALLLGFTPAWIVVRLRRPRPLWRVLVRQPGTVAALAMVLGLFWGTGALLILFPGHFDSMTAAPSAIGGAVAIAWGTLALTRKWESEPGWVDRVGRLLGCAAIGLAILLPLIFRI
jgi:hypothetical protein